MTEELGARQKSCTNSYAKIFRSHTKLQVLHIIKIRQTDGRRTHAFSFAKRIDLQSSQIRICGGTNAIHTNESVTAGDGSGIDMDTDAGAGAAPASSVARANRGKKREAEQAPARPMNDYHLKRRMSAHYFRIASNSNMVSIAIKHYVGDMHHGRFEAATQVTNQMLIKQYGNRSVLNGVIAMNSRGEYFPVEYERIQCHLNILFGPREYLAVRLTGAIRFGTSNIRHVYCLHFNDKSWVEECMVKEVSNSRERRRPVRDLSKSLETAKLRKELSYELSSESREFVNSSCRAMDIMVSDKAKPEPNEVIQGLIREGKDIDAWFFLEHQESMRRKMKKVKDNNHDAENGAEEEDDLVDVDEPNIDELAEKAKSQWVIADQAPKIAQARNFYLSVLFSKLSGRMEGKVFELESVGYKETTAHLFFHPDHNEILYPQNKAPPRKPKACKVEGCTKHAHSYAGFEYCCAHAPELNKPKCSLCNKVARRNGLCHTCGEPETRNERYFCIQCGGRMALRKNTRCSVCAKGAKCIECKHGSVQYAGRLCSRCYVAKGGVRKRCKLCDNIPKCKGGLCRGCFSRAKKEA